MGSNINETEKGTSLRESASFEPSCVKIRRRVWPVGEFPKKGINKFKKSVIFHPFAQKPPWMDVRQIWHSCRGRWRNHMWQMFWWSVEGCRFCMGLKFAISHWQSQSPLTLGRRYRAARDTDWTWTIVMVTNCTLSHCLRRQTHRYIIHSCSRSIRVRSRQIASQRGESQQSSDRSRFMPCKRHFTVITQRVLLLQQNVRHHRQHHNLHTFDKWQCRKGTLATVNQICTKVVSVAARFTEGGRVRGCRP